MGSLHRHFHKKRRSLCSEGAGLGGRNCLGQVEANLGMPELGLETLSELGRKVMRKWQAEHTIQNSPQTKMSP